MQAPYTQTKIPYATNEIEMPPKKKNKTTPASQQAARLPHRIGDPVQAQWSPNREQGNLSTNHVTKATSNQSAGLNRGDATLSTTDQSAGLMQFRTVVVAAPEPSYEANLAFQDNSLASFGPVKVATHPKTSGKTDSTK